MDSDKKRIQEFWNAHVNTTQFLDRNLLPGSDAFFETAHKIRYQTFPEILTLIRDLRTCGKEVLEIGCGMGCDLVEFAKDGAHVTGLDLTPAGVGLARCNLTWAGEQGKVVVGDAEHLPFPGNRFDIVYSLGVLHHTPDTQGAIHEAFRVLKPGGKAVIMLYHKWSWFVMLAKISGTRFEFSDEDAPVVKYYSETQARELFAKFHGVSITYNGYPFNTPRAGALAGLYNSVFVPAFNAIPRGITRKLGFHIYIQAVKK